MAKGGARWFTCGLTCSGHPVACVAGLKNIEIMEREHSLTNAGKVDGHVNGVLARKEGAERHGVDRILLR